MKSSVCKLISTISLFIIFLSCTKENNTQGTFNAVSHKSVKPRHGFVYTESNDAGTNNILSFLENANGTLILINSTASGGNGSGAALASEGALALSDNHHWLFAVNAGSNSISSFVIDDDGSLTLANTVSSNGSLPVSLTVHGNVLYVVNSTTANISGFTIGNGASLTLLNGSNQLLSGITAAPAEIKFTADGNFLVVTEKMTNKITTFPVNSLGIAAAGSSITSANTEPFGFDFSNNYAIVTEAAEGAANASTVSSYLIGANTNLTDGPVGADQTAACWAVATKNGQYVFVANTGSNTLSSFSLSMGNITVVNNVAANTGLAPADVTLSNNEFYLYNINGMSHSISEFKKGTNASLHSIGEVPGLPPNAAGLVAL
jgi:6-phosphogluconolactonase